MRKYRLGFIGAGKLAGSLIRGLVSGNFCTPGEVIASEPSEPARAALAKDVELVFTTRNAEVAEKAEVILLGVKPGIVLDAVREISGATPAKLVISLAAGVRLQSMESVANGRFMRAMTNTPSAVRRAATAVTPGSRTTAADKQFARQLFSSVGIVVEVTENEIDIVTALAGSGPAFIYSVIEALARAGERMGLSADVALPLATQTVLGAAQLAQETKLSPEELRRMVVTPGGTTAAGLGVMEQMKTAEGVIAAVEAAVKRAEEMAKENR